MVDISVWTKQFLDSLKQVFGDRIWFAGLQGSFSRGEAVDGSDIDIVVILDELSPSDVSKYNSMLDTLPNRELICGFFSGKKELLNWEPSDLFQFYYDTKPLIGSLDALLPLIDSSAVRKAIKTGVCNIYHGCMHNMLHEKSNEILKGLYKSATFVVQAICFLQTGSYVHQQTELLQIVSGDEQAILLNFLAIKSGDTVNFQQMSEVLLTWSRNWIINPL